MTPPVEPVAVVDWWRRDVWWWHAVFVGVCLLYGVVAVLDEASPAVPAIVAALVAWYAATGARALPGERVRLGLGYLAGVAVLLGAALWLDADAVVLLFVIYPQVFALCSSTRTAAALVVALTGEIVAVRAAAAGFAPRATVDAIVQGGINLAFALLLGLFISRIVSESERRADVLRELMATRQQLAEAHHREGQLAERTRLSHEIHDTLAQGFAGILALSRAASRRADDPDAVRRCLELVERTAADNLAEARALVAALSPAALEGASLPDALRSVADRASEETGVDVQLQVALGPTTVPTPHEVVLLRVAQEALANVRKHARASTVRIDLAAEGQEVRLTVADDGRGFRPAESSGPALDGGHGLPGMRSRVEAVGGTLQVTSAPGKGSTVQVRLPLARPAGARSLTLPRTPQDGGRAGSRAGRSGGPGPALPV